MNKKKPDVNMENRGNTMRVGNGRDDDVATFLRLALVVKIVGGVMAGMIAVGGSIYAFRDNQHETIARIDKNMADMAVSSAIVIKSVETITAACTKMESIVAGHELRIHGCELHDAAQEGRMAEREKIHEEVH